MARQADGTIPIGSMVPLSGPSAADGREFRNGLTLAVEEINRDGGILGRPIRPLFLDSGSQSAEEVVRATRVLIEEHGVHAIINGYNIGPQNSEYEPIADAGIIYIHHNTLLQHHDTVMSNPERYFGCFMGDPAEYWYGQGFIKFISWLRDTGQWQPRNSRIAIISGAKPYSIVIANAMASASAQFGWTLAFGPRVVRAPTADWRPVLEEIRARDPAVLANTHFYAGDLANFHLQFMENPIPSLLYLQYGALHRTFSDIVGDKGKGVIVGTVIGLPRDDLGRAFARRYLDRFGANSTPEIGCQPYTSMHHYAIAAAMAGGTGGPGEFDANRRLAARLKATIYRSVSGTVRYHQDWQAAVPYPDAEHDPSLGLPHLFYQVRGPDQQRALVAPEPYVDARFELPRMAARALTAPPDNPILNSPYAEPGRHWELNDEGGFTRIVGQGRRGSFHSVPVTPKGRKTPQAELDSAHEDAEGRAFEENALINGIRGLVGRWRLQAPQPYLTHETQRLLAHWRTGQMQPRPFFCQIEAIETLIWLAEVAPHTAAGQRFLEELRVANDDANPGLMRIAAKMATGAGKTTVMAMLIAWQAVNAARGRTRFSDAFLIVCPGITIRDRLKVLDPAEPGNYFRTRRVVPEDMLGDVLKAHIVITNFHAFKRRETLSMPKYAREVLQGRDPEPVVTTETEGEMLRRVCRPLLARRNVIVLNDEAHHCYQEKPGKSEEPKPGDEGEEIKHNKEAARLWINGLHALQRKLGVRAVYDLSATPFFLRGSGYPEGTLFPWAVSDFSLIDAIESGIVKIPRVPVSDNSLRLEMPVWRRLWPEIREDMPKKGAKKAGRLDTVDLPEKLLGALHGLYEHYEKVDANWKGFETPPVFIVVCQNTSHSKLLADYIGGYKDEVTTPEGETRDVWIKGRLRLFSNVDDDGRPLHRPKTLLIDSNEIDSGEALSAEFKKVAAAEIDACKQEVAARHGQGAAEKLTGEDLLREAMNTVGRPGRLGGEVRCVVSVSMLTEGWDANTVTHILGVRAFGTELLCEQVVGRGLRRVSYDVDDNGMLAPEHANIFGIPFSFASESKGLQTAVPPKPTIRVAAVPARVEADPALEIRFPRVLGYRVRLPERPVRWEWHADSGFAVTQDLTPNRARVEDILGHGETITLDNFMRQRASTAAFQVAGHALRTQFKDDDGNLEPYLFPRLLSATKEWLATRVSYTPGMGPGIFLWRPVADHAALRLCNAFVRGGEDEAGEPGVLPIVDPYNPEGSTAQVDFRTSKDAWQTSPDRCHVSHVVGDSDWELSFCETLEHLEPVRAYAKNHALGFEVPYAVPGGGERRYLPDFIVRIDDGHGRDLLSLVVEIKGYRRGDAALKAEAARTHWVPAVNNDGRFGRWAFVEFRDMYDSPGDIRAALGKAAGRG